MRMYASARETLEHLCGERPEDPTYTALKAGAKGAFNAALGGAILYSSFDEQGWFSNALFAGGCVLSCVGAYHLTHAALAAAKAINPPEPGNRYSMCNRRFTNRIALVDRIFGREVHPIDAPDQLVDAHMLLNGVELRSLINSRTLLYADDRGDAARGVSAEVIARWRDVDLHIELGIRQEEEYDPSQPLYIVAKPRGGLLDAITYGRALTEKAKAVSKGGSA